MSVFPKSPSSPTLNGIEGKGNHAWAKPENATDLRPPSRANASAGTLVASAVCAPELASPARTKVGGLVQHSFEDLDTSPSSWKGIVFRSAVNTINEFRLKLRSEIYAPTLIGRKCLAQTRHPNSRMDEERMKEIVETRLATQAQLHLIQTLA